MLQIRTNMTAGSGPSIGAFISALDELRKLHAEMHMQTATVFLLVAKQPGILQSDLPSLAGISQASVSRNVRALSKRHPSGKRGLGLIMRRQNGLDMRYVHLYPTSEGKALASRLLAWIGGATASEPIDAAVISQVADPMRFELSF